MEYQIIHRKPSTSRESTRAPEEDQGVPERQVGRPKQRKAFGPEAEAAKMTRAREKSSRPAHGSPFDASRRTKNKSSADKLTTKSVFSKDPVSSPARRHQLSDDNDVEVVEKGPERPRRSLRSSRPPHTSLTRQDDLKAQYEAKLHLRRPDDTNGEGSSSRSKTARRVARQSSSENEVAETEELPFPVQRSGREPLSGSRSSNSTGSRHGRVQKHTNSSPSRPPDKAPVELSDSEVEEKVEERPRSPGLLSPDKSPPKQLPRKVPISPASPQKGSLIGRMKKKDGSLPSAAVSPRRTSFPSTASSIPSSNVSATPAGVDWAFVTAAEDSDSHKIHAQSVSLRSKAAKKDHLVLALFGNDGKSVDLPLTEVRELQTNHSWFIRLKIHLSVSDANKLRALSGQFLDRSVIAHIALRKETGSQNLIDRAVDSIAKHVKVDFVTDDVVASFQRHYNAVKSAKASRPSSDASKKAAAAAEKRAANSKGKGKMPVSPSQSTLNFQSEAAQPRSDAVQPRRRSTRHSAAAANTAITTLSDDETSSTGRVLRRREPRLDKNDLLFSYPFEGRSSLDITRDSLYRLMDDDFLDDVTLEFGLRYTVAEAPKEKSLYLFNSFFYNKLSSRDKKPNPDDEKEWPAYDSVKKWTKAVDVFQREFIIVPVNENLHWYLAVIFNPRALIEPTNNLDNPAPQPMSVSASQQSKGTSASAEQSNDDKDPLDVISEGENEDGGVARLKEKVEECRLSPDSPKPIQSMELQWITNQDSFDASPKASSPAESNAKPKYKREAFDLLGSNRTYIMTFDSLGGSHKAVGDNLKRWLEFEARDKLQKEPVTEPIYIEAKVPQQSNFSDCGVFVIHFLWCLLHDTEKVLQFVGKAVPYAKEKEEKAEHETEMNQVWHAATTKELRQSWIEIITQLNSQWRELRGPTSSQAEADESLPRVEDSQASVVQLSAPDRPGTPTLPTVGEASEDGATGSERMSDKQTSVSSTSHPDTVPASLEEQQPLERTPVRAAKFSPDSNAGAQPEHPPPHARASEPPPDAAAGILSDSDSEADPSSRSVRMRTASTRASSREEEEIDGNILVAASQSKSRESSNAPSVLFSDDRAAAEYDTAGGEGTVVPDTLPESDQQIPHVPDSSEDECANGRIDLSGNHAPSAVPRDLQSNWSTKSKRNSSQFGSSPPLGHSPPSSPSRRQAKKPKSSSHKAKPVSDGYKQQTLSQFANVNGVGSSSHGTPERQGTPEKRTARKSLPGPDRSKKMVVEVKTARRQPVHTFKERDRGTKRAVSGPANVGGSEPKRPRSDNGAGAGPSKTVAGGSSQNPIDIDPSDEE